MSCLYCQVGDPRCSHCSYYEEEASDSQAEANVFKSTILATIDKLIDQDTMESLDLLYDILCELVLNSSSLNYISDLYFNKNVDKFFEQLLQMHDVFNQDKDKKLAEECKNVISMFMNTNQVSDELKCRAIKSDKVVTHIIIGLARCSWSKQIQDSIYESYKKERNLLLQNSHIDKDIINKVIYNNNKKELKILSQNQYIDTKIRKKILGMIR